MKIINLDKLVEFTQSNDYVHVGGDYYEDAGGHVVHEDEILRVMDRGNVPATVWKMFTKVHSSECGCEECENK